MTLKQTHFELGLLISHALFFQVFNATNNLKVTRVTHWFLDLNKNFTELKSDKACFGMFLIKYFATSFIFNGSAWINSTWQTQSFTSKSN